MANPKLRNRIVPSTAVDKELYARLKEYSKESSIPLSRLLDKAIIMYLTSVGK